MAKKTSSKTKIRDRISSRIVPASELEDYERFLIYGRSGATKTRLSATAPKAVIIDMDEKGTKSTRRDLNPHVFRADVWQDVVDFYWYLQEGDHDFETCCLDGATGMQTLCLNFVLGDEASRDASRDPDMPSRQVYGKVAKLMKTQITNYRNLPMHVVFTALVRANREGDDDDDLGGEVTMGPAVTPAVAGHLEAAVDTIGFLMNREVVVKVKNSKKRKKVRRTRLYTGPNEKYITKDRNNAFGAYVDSPDITEMIQLIKEA